MVWGRLRFVTYEGVDGGIIHQLGARKGAGLGWKSREERRL